MARGQTDQANKTYRESNQVYTGANANSQDLYKQLMPQYQQEATNPTGYDPKDLAAMNTASGQSVGGATASAVGDLGLQAARTGNAGGFAGAEDEAVRSGQRQLSANALGVQGANADLKQQQKQAGISGLASLYGGNTANMLSALGLQNQSTQTGTQAGQSGWFQNLTGLVSAINPGGIAAGMCPVAGSLILLPNGSLTAVEKLKHGMKVLGIDGLPDKIVSNKASFPQSVTKIFTDSGEVTVSDSHSFVRDHGGYALAKDAVGELLKMHRGTAVVNHIVPQEKAVCYHIETERSHSYCVNGFWSLT